MVLQTQVNFKCLHNTDLIAQNEKNSYSECPYFDPQAARICYGYDLADEDQARRDLNGIGASYDSVMNKDHPSCLSPSQCSSLLKLDSARAL